MSGDVASHKPAAHERPVRGPMCANAVPETLVAFRFFEEERCTQR
jgi:hypothetical protein